MYYLEYNTNYMFSNTASTFLGWGKMLPIACLEEKSPHGPFDIQKIIYKINIYCFQHFLSLPFITDVEKDLIWSTMLVLWYVTFCVSQEVHVNSFSSVSYLYSSIPDQAVCFFQKTVHIFINFIDFKSLFNFGQHLIMKNLFPTDLQFYSKV